MKFKIIFLGLLLVGCGGSGISNRQQPINGGGNNPVGNVAFYETLEYLDSSGLAKIKASAAYARGYVGRGQIVAVLDSPFDTDHIDFTDPNGDSAFLDGYDASSGLSGATAATCGVGCTASHGSHVAGIIGASRNGSGMHGVAYRASIKPVAIFDDSGDDDTNITQLADAIRQGSGPTIIAMNNSWGSTDTLDQQYQGNTVYYEAPVKFFGNFLASIELAAWQDGVDAGTIMVFSNGNDGFNSETGEVDIFNDSDTSDMNNFIRTVSVRDLLGSGKNYNIPSYRGSYPLHSYDSLASGLAGKWLTVVAINSANNEIASFSNGCGIARDFCLAAPGVRINSTIPQDNYGLKSGTSMAAPHVSGALAVLKSAFPNISSGNLVKLVLNTATDLGAPGTDPVYGRGMLNLQTAFQPQGSITAVGFNNQPLDQSSGGNGVLLSDTALILSHHFGTGTANLQMGIRDDYERNFIVAPAQAIRKPVEFGLADYLQDLSASPMQLRQLGQQTYFSFIDATDQQQDWMQLQHRFGQSQLEVSYHAHHQKNDLAHLQSSASQQLISSLQFSQIRPVGENISVMNVAQQLSPRVQLRNYVALGTFDTGHKFDELGTYLYYQLPRVVLQLGIGNLSEQDQFMGATATGAYSLQNSSRSRFTDAHLEHKLGKNLSFSLDYTDYETEIDLRYRDFARIEGLAADRYQFGLIGDNLLAPEDQLQVTFATKLGVRSGVLQQNTVLGYTKEGGFNNVNQNYSLAIQHRHQQFTLTYQGNLSEQQQASRFFVTMQYDQNFQHQAGVDQAKLIGGLQTDF